MVDIHVVYLLQYSSSNPKENRYYKIGITTEKRIKTRVNDLKRSLSDSKNYNQYKIKLVDKIQLTSFSEARKAEFLFHSHTKLRFFPTEKFDGYSELFFDSIIPIWEKYSSTKEFDPQNIAPSAIVKHCINESKRWKEAEKVILEDKFASVEYADLVLNSEWEELEDLLLKDSFSTWNRHAGDDTQITPHIYYVNRVRENKWLEMELKILEWIKGDSEGKKPRKTNFVVNYCINCREERWNVIEPWLLEGKEASDIIEYWKKFGLSRWAGLESRLLSRKEIDAGIDYWITFGDGPWIELEKLILRGELNWRTWDYAKKFRSGGWHELENHNAMKDPSILLEYCRHVLKKPWDLHHDFLLQSSPLLYSLYVMKKRTDRADEYLISCLREIDVKKYRDKQYKIHWNPNFSDYLKFFDSYWDNFQQELETALEKSWHLDRDLSAVAIIYKQKFPNWRGYDSILEILLQQHPNSPILNDCLIRESIKAKERNIDSEDVFLAVCDYHLLIHYTDICIENRWVELEKLLLQKKPRGDRINENVRTDYCVHYSMRIMKGRWQDCERMINGSSVNNSMKSLYAYFVMKEDWKEAGIYLSKRNKFTGAFDDYSWHEDWWRRKNKTSHLLTKKFL